MIFWMLTDPVKKNGSPTWAATLCFALIGVIVGGLAWQKKLVAKPGAPAASGRIADQRSESTGEDDEISGLKRSLGSALERIETLEAAAKERTVREDPRAAASGGGPPPETAEDVEARQEDIRQGLAEFTAAQVRDSSWAPRYEGTLRDIAAKQPGNTVVKELTCRTSVCRLEFSHANEPARHEFLRAFHASTPDAEAAHCEPVVAPDGQAKTTCYIFRRGYPLPPL